MKSKCAPSLASLFLFTTLLALAACGDDDASGDDDQPPGPECNALGGAACVLPLPSSIYEIEDSSSPTGRHIDFPDGVLPVNADNERMDPAPYNKMDGWTTSANLVMAWSTGFDPAGLPPVDDPAKSLEATSPTIIVDMTTGELVPHFAEIDSQAIDFNAPAAEQALLIRPVVRLAAGRQYAVGIRKSLKAPGGGALPITPEFQSLVDGTTSKDARIERVRPRYVEIFAALEAHGVAKTDLVVAWEFTTRSATLAEDDLIDARDAMLAAAGADAANVTYSILQDGPSSDPNTLRIVRGTIDFPSVLTGTGDDFSVLNRGADGKPAVNGTVKDDFAIVIPACASDPDNLPLPMVIYGHGLIGSLDETTGGYPRSFAQRACMAIIGTEWRGMEADDLTAIALALNNVNDADLVMEKLVQGMNQFVILQELARGKWATAPEFQDQASGKPLLDSTRVFYYGISQGGIFGGTFMAIDPFVTRGVLGVGAANYAHYIERSTNWQTYRVFMYNAYTESRLVPQILLLFMQTRWDLSDPITHISHLTGDVDPPYRNTPVKQVLMQAAVGDAQVANVGTDLWARTAGIPILEPAVRTPFGVPTAAGPLTSAVTFWDEHREPAPPLGNICKDDNGTHGSLRKRDKANEQIIHFFETGEIIQTCTMGGTPVACDCTTDEICGPDPS